MGYHCRERVPDHTDFMACGEAEYRDGRCRRHFLEYLRRLRTELADAKLKVTDLEAKLASLGSAKCEVPGCQTEVSEGFRCETHHNELVAKLTARLGELREEEKGIRSDLHDMGVTHPLVT